MPGIETSVSASNLLPLLASGSESKWFANGFAMSGFQSVLRQDRVAEWKLVIMIESLMLNQPF